MNNRHCGSILRILNQWRWERALANTHGSPPPPLRSPPPGCVRGGSGGAENAKAAPSVSRLHCNVSRLAMTNGLHRGSLQGAPSLSPPSSCMSTGPPAGPNQSAGLYAGGGGASAGISRRPVVCRPFALCAGGTRACMNAGRR